MTTAKIGKQTIHKQDCLEVMKSLPDNHIDLVVTSPPYNLNIKYSKYKDDSPREQYLIWMKDIFKELKRVLKDDGSIFLNMGSSNVDPWVCYEVAFVARELFSLQNDITWVKNISIKDKSYGHYKPINSERFLNHTHEKIWHFTKNNKVKLDRTSIGVPYEDKTNIKRWSTKEDLRCRGNSWFVPYETVKSKQTKGHHPAVFPSQLAVNCIRLHGYDENTRLLEPFLGSGSTLVACQQLGINGIGCEIDNDYFVFAKGRISDESV